MKIIGHRGAKGLAPENSAVALHQAIKHRVDAVEFDVRLTKDGVIILQHGPWLISRAHRHFRVAQYTLKELRQHRANLTTLDEALAVIDRRVTVLIEIKPGIPADPIVKALQVHRRHGWSAKHVVVISRKLPILRQVRAAMPELPLGVIDRWSGVRGSWRARRVGAKFLIMNQFWLWPGFIRAMSLQTWQLYAYGLDNPAKARRWAQYGLAGAITDYPDRYAAEKKSTPKT